MSKNKTVYLKDYTPPSYIITRSDLVFDLEAKHTTVSATHEVSRRADKAAPLLLHYDNLEIISIKINDIELSDNQYSLNEDGMLQIDDAPATFTLSIQNRITPAKNKALSGLYQSADMLCTQCEAEGFRRITPAIDRPDNLAIYTVTLRADKTKYPVLLSNGNLIEQGELEHNQHYAIWHDPFPKPTYLFALVAGNLNLLEDTYTTGENKTVKLHFYARGDDINKCHFAMQALKDSMQWDEQVYGRYYDLDIYNIVAVSDFNMGAMENKSLNIFNTKYVLADNNVATDSDYFNVESVIAHEYFHNWSGNRVTCRDWFQLSLKEGFTVFRDQEFSADQNVRGVTRIDDVNILRTHQFKEDSGPLAHPVRPESYTAIDNFYTTTVYNKGAEVVRMLRNLLGEKKFRQATDLYFEKFDGQAVTTDDFVDCMQQFSDRDLQQFKLWYSQAGTPQVDVTSRYDGQNNKIHLHFKQSIADTPGQDNKKPHVIPIGIALFSHDGTKISIDGQEEITFVLNQSEQTLTLDNIYEDAVPSMLRGFSAPVNLQHDLSAQSLATLAAYDDDAFCRWEAIQTLYCQHILHNYELLVKDKPIASIPAYLQNAFNKILDDKNSNAHILAKLLQLPNESFLSEKINQLHPHKLHAARRQCANEFATLFEAKLLELYHHCQKLNTGANDKQQIAIRALRDSCLYYIQHLDNEHANTVMRELFELCKNMTDASAALSAIANSAMHDKQHYLEQFYQDWQHEDLVVDKWLRAQALVAKESTLDRVIQLTQHESFNADNPNKVYSLLGAFAFGNNVAFHDKAGQAYEFIADFIIKLDQNNPQLAARLASAFQDWKHYHSDYANRMHKTLEKLAEANLSKNTNEIIRRSLS